MKENISLCATVTEVKNRARVRDRWKEWAVELREDTKQTALSYTHPDCWCVDASSAVWLKRADWKLFSPSSLPPPPLSVLSSSLFLSTSHPSKVPEAVTFFAHKTNTDVRALLVVCPPIYSYSFELWITSQVHASLTCSVFMYPHRHVTSWRSETCSLFFLSFFPALCLAFVVACLLSYYIHINMHECTRSNTHTCRGFETCRHTFSLQTQFLLLLDCIVHSKKCFNSPPREFTSGATSVQNETLPSR